MLRATIQFASYLWKRINGENTLVPHVILLTLHALTMGVMARQVTGSILDGVIVALLLLTCQRNSAEARKASLLIVLLILLYQGYAMLSVVAQEKNKSEVQQALIEWAECARHTIAYVQSKEHPAAIGIELNRRAVALTKLTFLDQDLTFEGYTSRLHAIQSASVDMFEFDVMSAEWEFPVNRFLDSSMGVPEELSYLRTHWRRASASLFVGQLLFVLILAFLVHSSHPIATHVPAHKTMTPGVPDPSKQQQEAVGALS